MKKLALAVILVGLWVGPALGLNYTELYPYLPNLPGFKAGEPTGMTVTTPAGEMTTAERTYTAEARRLTVRIAVGGMVQGMWFPLTMQVSYDTPEERMESLKVEGFPAKRITRKKEKGGTLVILLSRENASAPALFMMECEGLTPSEAQKYLRHFRLKELARKLNP